MSVYELSLIDKNDNVVYQHVVDGRNYVDDRTEFNNIMRQLTNNHGCLPDAIMWLTVDKSDTTEPSEYTLNIKECIANTSRTKVLSVFEDVEWRKRLFREYPHLDTSALEAT